MANSVVPFAILAFLGWVVTVMVFGSPTGATALHPDHPMCIQNSALCDQLPR